MPCNVSDFVRKRLAGKPIRANALMHGADDLRLLLVAVRARPGDQALKDEFLREGIAALKRLDAERG